MNRMDQRGSAPVIALLVVLPLLMLSIMGFSWMGHMAAAKGVVQEAASAGARYLSFHPGDTSGAIAAAKDVIDQAVNNGYMKPYTSSGLRMVCRDKMGTAGYNTTALSVRTDGYAQCVVWYDYQIPIRTFWQKNASRATPAWGGVGSDSSTYVTLAGEAFYLTEPQ